MSFGDRVKTLRRAAGMTQQDIANRLGITAAAVGMWECGKARPRLDTLRELADVFGVPVSDLVESSEVDPQLERLISNYARTTEEGRAALVAMSDALPKNG